MFCNGGGTALSRHLPPAFILLRHDSRLAIGKVAVREPFDHGADMGLREAG